jgi:hypothetical protein
MAELKTRPTDKSVETFLEGVPDERKRRDCFTVLELMKKVTKSEPRMWGPSIVGFGSYHYRYASGREADWMLTGFSPRKQNLTLYIMTGFDGSEELMARLGKHTTGKSCLYIKRLDDVHLPTLEKLIRGSVRRLKAKS